MVSSGDHCVVRNRGGSEVLEHVREGVERFHDQECDQRGAKRSERIGASFTTAGVYVLRHSRTAMRAKIEG